MFCPQCKAEYRPGFTVCADCEVPLVAQLPTPSKEARDGEVSAFSDAVPGSDDDPYCEFWKGDDPRVHAELCELLDEQGIPHKTVRRADHLFNLNSKSAFLLGVPFSYFERAEATIKEAYGSEESPVVPPDPLPTGSARGAEATIFAGLVEMAKDLGRNVREMPAAFAEQRLPESTAADSVGGEEAQSHRLNWSPEDWSPEDARIEVWSGDQPELGEMIRSSLGENQIHARLDQSKGKCALFVLPEDEARAREIVREVVEGVPPE